MKKAIAIILILILSALTPAALSADVNLKRTVETYEATVADIQPESLERFIFFTDPHVICYPVKTWSYFHAAMRKVQSVQEQLGISTVISGGDWIGSYDTNEEAIKKLSTMTKRCQGIFGAENFVPLMGNHDTNQQGSESAEERVGRTTVLSVEEYTQAMFAVQGSAYYIHEGENTRFYAMDTGVYLQGMNADNMKKYRWGQISWLADSLIQDDAPHSAIALHIFYESKAGEKIGEFATHIFELCQAYNNRETISKNGQIYDFTGCTGHVEFAIAGHIHVDYTEVYCGIPVIVTRTMLTHSETAFDVFAVDYDQRVIHIVRYGAGNDREVPLVTW
ncbi:MAG: metallophosphoesterase [Clostridia bacterium]|nr:metallophosphoesterase [Clostridia bacterium]